jgi:hypothetical protein
MFTIKSLEKFSCHTIYIYIYILLVKDGVVSWRDLLLE